MHLVGRKSQVSLTVHRSSAATFVAWGQWGFAGGVAIAVAMHPGFVLRTTEGGISDYGVHLKTAVPYDLALASASIGAYLAAKRADDSARLGRGFRSVLLAYATLVALTLVSTFGYTVDRPQRDLHVAVGSLLTLFEVAASLWMSSERRGDVGLVLVVLAGSVVGALTILDFIHLLFVSEIVTGGSFAVVLYRSTREFANRDLDEGRR